MALTERYVSVAGAGAHDGTTAADAWTFAEMIAAAPAAGVRVNMISGSYSQGVTTLPAGAANTPFVIRGYNATIGDLDNQGRNADGTLNTTNMPDVTITGLWAPAIYNILQNLDITGALSSALIGSGTVDRQAIISCRIINTQNNASARAFQADDSCLVVNSDFDCTGAAHATVCAVSTNSYVKASRFHGTDTDALLTTDNSQVINSLFYGNSSSIGIDVISVSGSGIVIDGCTFQGIGTAVRLPNSVNAAFIIAINNICTDGTKWIDSQYVGTATMALVESNNRTRDVTTLLTGMEGISIGAVTTDTGGPETDYVDYAAGNFRLIAASPANAVGLTPYMDIGAYQREQAAAGGGGGSFGFIG